MTEEKYWYFEINGKPIKPIPKKFFAGCPNFIPVGKSQNIDKDMIFTTNQTINLGIAFKRNGYPVVAKEVQNGHGKI